MIDSPPTTAVVVATYRRPALLEALLTSICALDRPGALRVVVVDNDPDQSARPVLEAMSPPIGMELIHVTEGRAGIAQARNTGVAHCGTVRRLAFIDDDEVATPDWLTRLERALDRSPAAAAAHGSVEYIFELAPPRWIERGGFFINPDARPGDMLPFAATNNLMIDLDRIPAGLDMRFDERYGLTGGSDIALTTRIVEGGAEIIWVPEAVVRERVPADRLTPSWCLRRAYRTGNTLARVRLDRGGRLTPVKVGLGGAARVGCGGLRTLAGLLTRDSERAGTALRQLARGLGAAAAVLRVHYAEYARASVRRA